MALSNFLQRLSSAPGQPPAGLLPFLRDPLIESSAPPTFWAPEISSVEKGFPTDWFCGLLASCGWGSACLPGPVSGMPWTGADPQSGSWGPLI